MTTLLFIRHGIPEDGALGQPDADRPLSLDGRQKTRAAMKGLVQRGFRPTRGCTSPFRRARETMDALLEASGGFPVDVWDDLVPEASPLRLELSLRALLSECGDEEVVALTSHQPITGEMVRRLTGRTVEVKRASATIIRWEGQAFRFLAHFTPAELRET